MVLYSTTPSSPLWLNEASKLLDEIPADLQDAIRRHEESGDYDARQYREATRQYNERFVCRNVPWPEMVRRTFNEENRAQYREMWGPSEFNATGKLREWDVTDRLPTITTPTLVISGEFDEATAAVQEVFERKLPNVTRVQLPGCSHMSTQEDLAAVLGALISFFD